jgi:hypothetical protein
MASEFLRPVNQGLVNVGSATTFSDFVDGTYGSEQEFDKRSKSRGSPEHDEFGFGDGHTLSLEEQVA